MGQEPVGLSTEFYPLQEDQALSPNMELWMGVWGARSKTNTSNWKELRTIQEALEQEVGRGRVRNHTVFYFTDNLVSYYIVAGGSSRSPELQRLVLRIKELEQELGCHFEVVHVPGTMMI